MRRRVFDRPFTQGLIRDRGPAAPADIFAHRPDQLPEAQPGSPGCAPFGPEFIEVTPLARQRPPRPPDRALRVVDVRRFRPCSVQLDDREPLAPAQRLLRFVADIEAPEIE